MNIMEAQKLTELEATMPIFHAKRTGILVEKLTYGLLEIYQFLAISQDISLTFLHHTHHKADKETELNSLSYSIHKCIY